MVKQGLRLVVGSWKIIATSLADQRAARLVRDAQQVVAGKAQVLRAHAARVGDQAHQRHHRHALAGARLADDAEHLALFHGEADAVDGMQHAALRRELDMQILDVEKTHVKWPRCAWRPAANGSGRGSFQEHRGTGFAGPLVLPPRGGYARYTK